MTWMIGQPALRSFAGDTTLIMWQGRSRGTLIGWTKGLTGIFCSSVVTSATPSISGRKTRNLIPAGGSTGYRAALWKNTWGGLIIFYYYLKEQSGCGEGFWEESHEQNSGLTLLHPTEAGLHESQKLQ